LRLELLQSLLKEAKTQLARVASLKIVVSSGAIAAKTLDHLIVP